MSINRQVIFYSVIAAAVLIFAIGFALSQYIEYKQLHLSQQKAIQDCIQKTAGDNETGFIATNKAQKCRDAFSQ